MGPIDFSSIAALFAALSALTLLALAMRVRRLRQDLAVLRSQRDQALVSAGDVMRLMRQSAQDLREPALRLLGEAERLPDPGCAACACGSDRAASIAAASAIVLDLADTLQDHAAPDAASRVLREAPVPLGPLLAETIEAVRLLILPGRRCWRIDPDLQQLVLLADRRALRQILTRVLCNAARYSRDEDWVDIQLERPSPDRIALVIADEGVGICRADPTPAGPADDSRGLGFGLALARSLMVAHGGTLDIRSVPDVGTRVSLGFPAARAIPAA